VQGLIESTYGDREHPKEDVLAELAPLLRKLVARGGGAGRWRAQGIG